ncbi:MAG: GNAT family N-acetyltransferase [Dehalococcoidia bacterium]|mgnify:FL=1|uniref:GNAT family N-acetyltransferase n=1 Tax=Candidatus Amarobacter glycogenicus TaxID=3140699 RepID=UPI0031360E08|nr:GNAT family N-acetyltransferase [Dehalococcoidia bacterium]
MPDMIVNLYDLAPVSPQAQALRDSGVVCRRAESYERSVVLAFVERLFPDWADELRAGFAAVPPNVYIATEEGTLLGFACYNATRPDYFGPTGVEASQRRRGIGRVLLLQCLEALRAQGYAYAIIGGVGPAEFYEKAAGATLIPASEPGIYRDRLNRSEGDGT